MSNLEFIKGLYEAFGRGDVPTVLGAMAPQIAWYEAEGHPYTANGEAFTGPDAILNNVFMKLGADFDEFALHPKTFHDAGNAVVVEGRTTGTNRKPAVASTHRCVTCGLSRTARSQSFSSTWTQHNSGT